MRALFTIGHGTASQAGFALQLRAAGVASLVDVRIGPGSRKQAHFGKDRLADWLPDAGIGYRWEQRLGGFRRLIADHCLLLAGLSVKHLMPPAKSVPHVPTQGVRVLGNGLRYDVLD